ncbi:Exonuclease VII, large subunit [uncultured Paludibacter sp.]|uniref:Exodeoxyribonuclease 7 large subunit n=1 Tax=uncultured Paludibacter sp. TaxID=497635 RepID=A0A653A9C3_9BACT|nr:Exonuclease VII, large subunit [uncultured Paludibacter sp.]
MDSISLSQLTAQIQETLRQEFNRPVWIRAEISECRENNGHCYLELIEKESNSDVIIAKSRATIWANTYRMLKPYFEGSTGQALRSGMSVLVMVMVDFSGQYGFNLIIRDIDPTFTIGEMAARRMEIIRQLEADGVIDMNKQIAFPPLPQRLAIISSSTAAGYDDFCNQLRSYSFAFYTKLFPAVMQGEQAEQSIIKALEKIYSYVDFFDAVLIIRGGGATTDLTCFDSYNLALNCAQFPLPIIAGIGHTRDVSVLDMVAHTSVKTPTAAAEFLVNLMAEEENNVNGIVENIQKLIKNRIENENQQMDLIRYKIKQAVKADVIKRNYQHDKYKIRLKNRVFNLIQSQQNQLRLLENKITIHSPVYLLKHGYTITLVNGKRVTSITDISIGDKIKTFVADGTFDSEVKNTSK